MTDLLIELPWPPKQLTPNFKRRKHWSAYRKPSSDYRTACRCIVNAGLAHARGARFKLCSVTFYPPDHRKRDDDGMIGAFKAGRDGVADALGCDDHTFRPTYHFAEPTKPGKIVIRLEAAL